MKETLRVLIVEDSPADALLLIRELKLSRYEIHSVIVMNKNEFLNQLAAHKWDCIISDFRLPQFSALDALNALKSTGWSSPKKVDTFLGGSFNFQFILHRT